MRTSNPRLLAEIDHLESTIWTKAENLEVVKRIEELESNEIKPVFFIVKNKNMELFFSKRENAEEFLSKQTATSGMRLIATCFADVGDIK